MSKIIVGKPKGELLLVGGESYMGTWAKKYLCEERVYWHVIDSLGNDIWYTLRPVPEDAGEGRLGSKP